MKPCPGFQMKCSFPQTSPGASLNWIHFSVLLPIWLLLICHGFVHVMRLWPAHNLNLSSFEVSCTPDSYFFFSLKEGVCSQTCGTNKTLRAAATHSPPHVERCHVFDIAVDVASNTIGYQHLLKMIFSAFPDSISRMLQGVVEWEEAATVSCYMKSWRWLAVHLQTVVWEATFAVLLNRTTWDWYLVL